MDKFRAGLLYYSAGQRVVVEAGFTPIGHTTLCPKTGQQVFWFKDLAQFEKYRKDIFENTLGIHRPVPVFEEIVDAVVSPPLTPTLEPDLPPPLPPAETNEISQIKDRIFEKHGGRKIRIKEFAEELGIEPDTLQNIIENDPRYAPIAAGWVRLVESQQPQ